MKNYENIREMLYFVWILVKIIISIILIITGIRFPYQSLIPTCNWQLPLVYIGSGIILLTGSKFDINKIVETIKNISQ